MGYQDGPGFFMPAPEGAMSVVSETVVLIACAALFVTAGSSYRHANPA
jgi:hypothetical protein